MKISARQFVARGLGVLWIIDGLLQLQPQMFGQNFISNVLAPNLGGQPALLHSFVSLGIAVFSVNIPVANAIAALLQIAIGIFLFFPESEVRFTFGLYASIVWGLIVWVFGEGMGGLLNGSATLYNGAPGSALIYVILSVILLVPIFRRLRIEPFSWVAGLCLVLLSFLQLHPVLLFVLPLVLGILLMIKPNRGIGIAALIFLFFVWWFGQDFGGLGTLLVGTATDPNTAPVLMLAVGAIFFEK